MVKRFSIITLAIRQLSSFKSGVDRVALQNNGVTSLFVTIFKRLLLNLKKHSKGKNKMSKGKNNNKATESKATESKATESKATESKATESKATESIDTIINNIDNEVKKLALFILGDIKGLLPQNKLDIDKVNKEYETSIAIAKKEFMKDNDTEKFISAVDTAKAIKEKALNSSNLWQAVASEYEIDKDFLAKCGFKELSDKENSNKFNTLITSIFNVVKYAHSTKNKLEDCKKAYESIGSDKLCKVFKHGCYGAKKTYNAVKGKEGINTKVEVIDTLYTLLTK